MKEQSSCDQGRARPPGRIIERIIYFLVTSALCAIPFLLPGIALKQGALASVAIFLF